MTLEATIDATLALLERWEPGQPLRAPLDLLVAQAWRLVAASAHPEAATRAYREALHPYFLQAPGIRHAWAKPRGYAGDAALMDMAYANRAAGDTPLGRALHLWFSNGAGPAAVRARRRWILLQMQAHGRVYPTRWRGLSVASGTAWELRDLLAESFLVETADVLCIDQDPEALAAAEAGLARVAEDYGRSFPARFERVNIRAILSGAWVPPEQDFTWSLGLYDYLDAAVARRLTERLVAALAPGGRLVVGNYLPSSAARPAIELLMDWHLVYRTEAELAALGAGLGEARVELDSTGTMAFLVVTR